MTEDVRAVVRSSIDAQVEALAPDTPPYPRVQRGMRAVAVRRRRRRLTGAVATAAAALVVGGVAQVVPLLRSTPPASVVEQPDPDDDGPSPLDTGVIRGALAGDAAWIADLRERVLREHRGSWGEGLRPRSTRDVHVLYADDVDRWRVALVEIGGSPSLMGGGRQQVWYSHRRGAAASEMRSHPGSGAGPVTEVVLWGEDGIEAPPGPRDRQAVVALSTDPAKVPRFATSPEIGADGVVRWTIRQPKPVGPQVYQDVLTPGWAPVFSQTPWNPWWVRYRIPSPVVDESLAAGLELPGTVPVRQVALGFALIRHHYGLDVAALPRRLVWAGRVEGWDVAVVAVTVPNGAHVLAVSSWDPALGPADPLYTGTWSGETAVLPAGLLDRQAIAWSRDSKEEAGHPFHVFVLAPRGAAAVRVEDAGVVARARVDGPGVVSVRHEPQREGFEGARVRVLDAAGRTIAVTGVNTQLSSDPLPPRPSGADGTP